jgi:hypothetical protein
VNQASYTDKFLLELTFSFHIFQTGKYRQGDEKRSAENPVKIFDSFAAFIQKELFDAGIVQTI